MEEWPNAEVFEYTARSASGFGNGSGLSKTPLTTEKSAVFAPMPRANVRIAMAAKPELLDNTRKPKRTSCQKFRTRTPSRPGAAGHPRYAAAERFVPSAAQ